MAERLKLRCIVMPMELRLSTILKFQDICMKTSIGF